MSRSVAKRQRRYRERHLKGGTDERLHMVVSVQAKRRLERLARHYGITQHALLERLLAQAEKDVVDALKDQAGYQNEALAAG